MLGESGANARERGTREISRKDSRTTSRVRQAATKCPVGLSCRSSHWPLLGTPFCGENLSGKSIRTGADQDACSRGRLGIPQAASNLLKRNLRWYRSTRTAGDNQNELRCCACTALLRTKRIPHQNDYTAYEPTALACTEAKMTGSGDIEERFCSRTQCEGGPGVSRQSHGYS